MSDKSLTTFLTEWGGQVKELIEPKKEKLTPEFYLGSKANPRTVISHLTSGSSINEYEYIGDGELSTSKTGDAQQIYFAYWEDPPALHVSGANSRGTVTIISAETDNYKAGEWTFEYYLGS